MTNFLWEILSVFLVVCFAVRYSMSKKDRIARELSKVIAQLKKKKVKVVVILYYIETSQVKIVLAKEERGKDYGLPKRLKTGQKIKYSYEDMVKKEID